jgi:hypothetical protein
VQSIKNGTRIKEEKGYIFPVTLILSFLLSLYLLHQIELYRLEKMFYHESNQLLELEGMMKYTWDAVHKELLEDKFPPIKSIQFRNGQSSISAEDKFPQTRISILCVLGDNRRYEALIVFDRESKQIISWTEYL